MDLTARLLRFAIARPHVLVVPTVGGTAARLAVEVELARRGWPAARSPADADLLVVAGTAGPSLGAAVDAVWQRIPAPSARTQVGDPDTAGGALDDAAAQVNDIARQRREATASHSPGAGRPVRKRDAGRHQSPEGPTRNHQGHHRSHGDGTGQHGHDHHVGMGMPAGLPMADLGEDRDGLMLDQLHVVLGPVLPDWPAGLVVETVLQGDVIQQARAEILDAPSGDASGLFWAEPTPARADEAMVLADVARRASARHLDGLARLLAVAGWTDPAAAARRLRDELLAGAPAARVRPAAVALAARVRRSRTLRWLLRGIRTGDGDVCALLVDRLAALYTVLVDLDDLRPVTSNDLAHAQSVGGSDGLELHRLAALLVGAELASARLLVAAVDPDTDAIAATAVPGQAHHGW